MGIVQTALRAVVSGAALFTAVPAFAATNLITNGSFEQGAAIPAGGFLSLTAGSNAITGWTVGGSGVDYIGTYWQAADGTRSLDLSGSTIKNNTYAGSVSQSFATIAGKTYQVAFSLAGNPDGNPLTKVELTSATDNSGISQLYASTFTVVPGVNTRANMGWQRNFFQFTATGSNTTLNFQSAVNSAYGAALDNVSVTAVPEPAAWAMMISGFGLAGYAARRRRTKVVYA